MVPVLHKELKYKVENLKYKKFERWAMSVGEDKHKISQQSFDSYIILRDSWLGQKSQPRSVASHSDPFYST